METDSYENAVIIELYTSLIHAKFNIKLIITYKLQLDYSYFLKKCTTSFAFDTLLI